MTPVSFFWSTIWVFNLFMPPKLTWQTEKQERIKMYLSLIKLVMFHCCVSFRGCSWSTTPFQLWHEVHFFVVSVWRGGVGWGCYRSLNLHTWSMLRLLRGLGWGGDVTVPWTCTHGRCYMFGSFFCLNLFFFIHSTSYSHGMIPASFISDFYNAGCHSWPMPETRVAVLRRRKSMDIEMCIWKDSTSVCSTVAVFLACLWAGAVSLKMFSPMNLGLVGRSSEKHSSRDCSPAFRPAVVFAAWPQCSLRP